MNKQELSQRIAFDLGITEDRALTLVNSFCDNLCDAIKNGETVDIDQLGSFKPSKIFLKNFDIKHALYLQNFLNKKDGYLHSS